MTSRFTLDIMSHVAHHDVLMLTRKLLSLDEAGAEFGIGRTTLRGWVEQGKLPAVTGGGHTFIHRQQVEALKVAESRQESN